MEERIWLIERSMKGNLKQLKWSLFLHLKIFVNLTRVLDHWELMVGNVMPLFYMEKDLVKISAVVMDSAGLLSQMIHNVADSIGAVRSGAQSVISRE